MPADGPAPGPVFCLLLRVSSDYAQPITGQITEVTCPEIDQAQPGLTPSKRQKTGPGGSRPAASTVLNTKWCNFCPTSLPLNNFIWCQTTLLKIFNNIWHYGECNKSLSVWGSYFHWNSSFWLPVRITASDIDQRHHPDTSLALPLK